MRVLLIGNPNVGKSAVFSQLTGISVTTSNYPGTTVEFTRGQMTYMGQRLEVIDVPGTYGLDPQCEAERVAVEMIAGGDVLVNVVDATNLERNLNLTLQLIELSKPMVVALNMWDEAGHKGIAVEAGKLGVMLGIPVVPTNGLTGEGLLRLREECVKALPVKPLGFSSQNGRWKRIGEIVSAVQNLSHRRHTALERVQDLSIHPLAGPPLAILVLLLAFRVILYAGDLLTSLALRLFDLVYAPLILWLSRALGGGGFLHALLIGEISGGKVDFEGAMGVLTTGVFVALGLVLPFIFLFYLVLGYLEDLGYLPRVAVIFDRMLHRVGLHGYSIIPMLLGCGCNVPGVLAVRNLETRRERFITAVMTGVTIPCMAQIAMIIRTTGARGTVYLALTFTTLITVWVVLGVALKHAVRGRTPTLLIEIPPYRLPSLKIQCKKLAMRLRCFIHEAIPYLLGGVAFINTMNALGVIARLGRWSAPVIEGVFGLPERAVSALIIGVLRKDAAVALLEPLGLNDPQLIVAVVVLVLYFPCVATFAVLLRELGLRDMVKAMIAMFAVALAAGGLLHLLLGHLLTPGLLIALEGITIILILGGSGLADSIGGRRKTGRADEFDTEDVGVSV